MEIPAEPLVSLETSQQQANYYRAVVAKDARFDGVFFTAVKTTGIYCRPVCTAKTPKLSSCQFFALAAAAEAAGFRPCLRCRPELAPYDLQQNLAHGIWQKIISGYLNEASIEDLAAEVGLSARQIRRVMLQEFGVTPVELAQTQRLLFAKNYSRRQICQWLNSLFQLVLAVSEDSMLYLSNDIK